MAVRHNRELKHEKFLLSRRPTGTKLLADVAYLNTSCGCGDHHGGLQAALCLRVGLSDFGEVFPSKEWHQTPKKLSINHCKLIIYLQLLQR